MSAKIIDALTVVAEITGATLSVPAIKGIAMELAQHPEHEVLKALAKCKRECKYRLTLADILERIDQSNGFIGADEAWSLACQAMDESATVVMTEQITQAWGVARDVMPDKVGARMAFRQVFSVENFWTDVDRYGCTHAQLLALGFALHPRGANPTVRQQQSAYNLDSNRV